MPLGAQFHSGDAGQAPGSSRFSSLGLERENRLQRAPPERVRHLKLGGYEGEALDRRSLAFEDQEPEAEKATFPAASTAASASSVVFEGVQVQEKYWESYAEPAVNSKLRDLVCDWQSQVGRLHRLCTGSPGSKNFLDWNTGAIRQLVRTYFEDCELPTPPLSQQAWNSLWIYHERNNQKQVDFEHVTEFVLTLIEDIVDLNSLAARPIRKSPGARMPGRESEVPELLEDDDGPPRHPFDIGKSLSEFLPVFGEEGVCRVKTLSSEVARLCDLSKTQAESALRRLEHSVGKFVTWTEFQDYVIKEGYIREDQVDVRLFGVRSVREIALGVHRLVAPIAGLESHDRAQLKGRGVPPIANIEHCVSLNHGGTRALLVTIASDGYNSLWTPDWQLLCTINFRSVHSRFPGEKAKGRSKNSSGSEIHREEQRPQSARAAPHSARARNTPRQSSRGSQSGKIAGRGDESSNAVKYGAISEALRSARLKPRRSIPEGSSPTSTALDGEKIAESKRRVQLARDLATAVGMMSVATGSEQAEGETEKEIARTTDSKIRALRTLHRALVPSDLIERSSIRDAWFKQQEDSRYKTRQGAKYEEECLQKDAAAQNCQNMYLDHGRERRIAKEMGSLISKPIEFDVTQKIYKSLEQQNHLLPDFTHMQSLPKFLHTPQIIKKIATSNQSSAHVQDSKHMDKLRFRAKEAAETEKRQRKDEHGEEHNPAREFRETTNVTCAEVHPHESRIAMGLGDGQIALYHYYREFGARHSKLHQTQGWDASRNEGDIVTALHLPASRLAESQTDPLHREVVIAGFESGRVAVFCIFTPLVAAGQPLQWDVNVLGLFLLAVVPLLLLL
jgi:hypothetical protein